MWKPQPPEATANCGQAILLIRLSHYVYVLLTLYRRRNQYCLNNCSGAGSRDGATLLLCSMFDVRVVHTVAATKTDHGNTSMGLPVGPRRRGPLPVAAIGSRAHGGTKD